MDLQLNVTSESGLIKIKKLGNKKSGFNNRRNVKKPGGFDFKFTKTDNIKAIVARKKVSNPNVDKTELNKVNKKAPGSIIKKSNNPDVAKQSYSVLQKSMVTQVNHKDSFDNVPEVKIVKKPFVKPGVNQFKRDQQPKVNAYRNKSINESKSQDIVLNITKNTVEEKPNLQDSRKLPTNVNAYRNKPINERKSQNMRFNMTKNAVEDKSNSQELGELSNNTNAYRNKPINEMKPQIMRFNMTKNVDEEKSNSQESGKLKINMNVLKALDDMKLNEKKAKLTQNHPQRSQINTDTNLKPEINKPDGVTEKKNLYVSKMYENKKKTEYKKPDIQKGKFSSLFSNNPDIPKIGQRLVKPATETLFTGALVSTLGLHAHSVKNLSDLLEIKELTTVQQRTIPHVLAGRDMLVRSQTGSGKTLAYSLPVIEKLQEIRPKLTRTDGIQALVIVPTRELAVQAYDLYLKLLKPFTWIVPGFLCGGEKRKAEKARLRRGINILVGTPGRLCDHLVHTESFNLNTVKWLILDEADKLLEFGYEKDVRKIVDAIKEKTDVSTKSVLNKVTVIGGDNSESDSGVDDQPSVEITKKLQTILLSATLTKAVEKLAGMTLNNPLFIDTSDVLSEKKISSDGFHSAVQEAVLSEQLIIPSTVVQTYVLVPPKLRLVVLSGMIAGECNKKASKILVFMPTQDFADYHHDVMVEILTKKILDPDDNIAKIDSDDEDEDNLLGRNDDDDDTGDALLNDVQFFKLHGSMTQQERSGVFKAFIDAKSGVLLTTDVAGRGIDVPKVDIVIQYSAPQKMSDYVHRVGRTARAGRKGRAVIFLGPNETDFVHMLEEKGIRIGQEDMKKHLDNLLTPICPHKNAEVAANDLQHNFEVLVNEDKEIHDKACKAFISWIRYYSAFPKDLRTIFNVKGAHMGHYAKSVGLREPPTSFARRHAAPKPAKPQNRLTMVDRDDQSKSHQQQQRNTGVKRSASSSTPAGRGTPGGNNYGPNNKLEKFAKKSITLTTSEFDSGFAPNKKRKKK